MTNLQSTELTQWINKIHCGGCLELLRQLPDNTVDCVVTSPPYYGLRDYGTATWEGGDPDCSHKRDSKKSARGETGSDNVDGGIGDAIYKNACSKCGAVRIDSQIGLEETPEVYVQKLVEVFEEVRRVLKPEGTCWIVIGDSYAGSGKAGNNPKYQKKHTQFGQVEIKERLGNPQKAKSIGLKPKDLIGVPWMLAFALRANGWWLRQDIIYSKPNPMPESVTDRCTKSHEYIFLLTKSARYYYDADAIKEPIKDSSIARLNQNIENQAGSIRVPGKTNGPMKAVRPHGIIRDRLLDYDSKEAKLRSNVARGGFNSEHELPISDGMANKRSVWTVTTKPFSEAHFATFPEDLIAPCIKAGCPEDGVVLDPFMGAGTTAIVARKLNRNYIGIELSPEYIKIAEKRIQKELGMFL